VAPLHALRDDTLPTVRISETPTAHIDLWTSRNRVASVGDRAAVARWLSRVSGDAVHRSRRDLSSDAELQLRRILEFDADNDERPSCQRRAGP
jgi:hypothetical protein